MANSIKIKRSAVAAKVPLTTDLALGELAINTYDGKLYLKKDDGTEAIVTVNAGGAGSGDVVGPGSSTDNAITRFDGATGKLIQNSTATLDDSGVVSVSGANISGLTASSAVATDGSSNLVSVANTGTGDNVLATSPTLITPALGTPTALVGTNISGTAAAFTASNVTTNANLTGPITSVGNATSIASQTGTGSTFVMNTSPVLVTPALGTPSALVGTNITGTAAGLTAGTVTTNANLIGPITSVGNTTSIASQTGTGTTFAMSASPTFTGTVGAAALTTTGNTILGDASTDTLNVGNGGLVKDASGNVGIGTASPSAKLNVVTSGGNSRISIGDTAVATYSTVLMYGGNGKYNWQLGAQTNINNGFEITPSTAAGGTTFSTPAFIVDSTGASTFTGTGKFATTIGVGNATPAASGSGITFPATQSASSDANTLDDYEEGTWTPSLGGTATYTTQSGSYIKIGRMVTVKCTIGVLLIGTGSAYAISGLPFACNNLYGLPVGYFDTINTSVISLGVRTVQNQTNMVMTGVASSTTAITDSFSTFKNSTYLEFSGTYFVA